jgi:arylsulfatase A-like enzyme
MPQPPHILYLHSHDTGRHIGPYGRDTATPHLQRLADQGMLFSQAFCVSPTCSPSRAGLLTGQWPHQCGQLGLSNRGYPLQHPERHIAHALTAAGYRTALLGIQHVTDDEHCLGYTDVDDQILDYHLGGKNPETSAPDVASRVQRWLDDHGRGDRPWFIDAGMIETHTGAWPLLTDDEQPTPRQVDRARPPAIVPDAPETRQWYARQQVMAAKLDAGIGRILAKLDDLGLADDTLVIYTTDHGLGLPTAKCNLTDAGLEVGLILRGPSRGPDGGPPHFRGGRTSHAMVDHLDVIPTLCDVAGLEMPAWCEGRSLVPLATDPRTRLHDALFSEINVHGGSQPERSVRTDRYRLVRRWSTPEQLVGNTDDKPPTRRMRQAGWPHTLPPGRPAGEGQARDWLFDLELDPTHRVDRSLDASYATVYGELADRLDQWMHRTGDYLLGGADTLPGPGPTLDVEVAEAKRRAH